MNPRNKIALKETFQSLSRSGGMRSTPVLFRVFWWPSHPTKRTWQHNPPGKSPLSQTNACKLEKARSLCQLVKTLKTRKTKQDKPGGFIYNRYINPLRFHQKYRIFLLDCFEVWYVIASNWLKRILIIKKIHSICSNTPIKIVRNLNCYSFGTCIF